jgi:Fic family protein
MKFDPQTPFLLPPLPPETDLQTQAILQALIPAHRALAELNGYSAALPNPMLLLSPAIVRESVASSEIENINTTLVDVLTNELFTEAERRPQDKEVLRYRDAVLWAFEQLPTIGLTNRLIIGAQKQLIPDYGGRYRQQQVRIANSTTGEVHYTPPIAPQIPALLSNWQEYVNNTEGGVDPLVMLAVAHYQFEAIHPFEDGNGRTGRILMVMQLIEYGLLEMPILYLSGYINEHRSEYYKKLRAVTSDETWEDFALYILTAVETQAIATKSLLVKIADLYKEYKQRLGRDYPANLIDALFAKPITSPTQLAKVTDIHYTTASKYLKQLTADGLLTEKQVGKFRLYANQKLLKMINGA